MADVAVMERAEKVRPVGLPVMLQAVLVAWALLAALAVPAGVPRFRQMAALAAAAWVVLAALAAMPLVATREV